MSKTRIVEMFQQNGVNYGQISSPLDLIKSQDFAHQHVEKLTQDFLMQVDPEVAGCAISLETGLRFQIAAGQIYRGGVQYESEDQDLTLDPVPTEFSRIDVVVAVLTPNVPAQTEFLAFQRLRTTQELNSNSPAYPPTQFQRATERHNVAAITVKTGTPSVSPQAPALEANEIALYQITVPPNATNLLSSNISDVRKVVSNLRAMSTQIAALLESLLEIQRKLAVLKYRFPTISAGDGRCPAVINQDENNNYVIDIPVGVVCEFGDRFVYVDPISFDPALGIRRSNASNAPAVNYQVLFEGETLITPIVRNDNTSGNVIRINAPTTQKWLYLGYDGRLFFLNTAQNSDGDKCLLLRITPVSGSAPTLKAYRNLRNSMTKYSKVALAGNAASTQFELDIGMPVGYLYYDCYAIRASDQTRYEIPLPSIAFDSIVNVAGVTSGDRWVINLSTLSAL